MMILTAASLANVKRAHARVKAATTSAIAAQMAEAGEHAVMHVQAHPTFKPRTGNLQGQAEWTTVRNSRGRILRLKNRAPYAAFVEYGTRPHVIRPKKRRFLRFTVRGNVVFARKVNHPGTRPYKFLYRASSSAGRFLQQGLAAQLVKIARKF